MSDEPIRPDSLRKPKPGELPNRLLNQRRESESPAYQTSQAAPPGPVPMEALSRPYGETTRIAGGTIKENGWHRDYFSLTAEETAAMPEGCTPYWARRADIWEKVELNDRPRELMDAYPGASVVSTPNSPNGARRGYDLLLMALPTPLVEQRQAEIDAARVEYEADLEPVDDEDGDVRESHVELWDRSDTKALNRQARQQHALHKKLGIVGESSRTSGMDLLAARRLMGRERMEQDQETFRNMGQHMHGDGQAAYRDMLVKSAGDMGKSFAFGDTGLGKTTRDKVAKK